MTVKDLKPAVLSFEASKSAGKVSALLTRPEDARWIYVLAHGAGAGMRHPFLETISASLAARGIAAFRYQFPYMERKSRRPDPRPILLATVRSAVETARKEAGNLPLLAGGKSMGGRMTSLATAEAGIPEVCGIVFLGFPLHPPGTPSIERAEHLDRVTVPMLFLQGTRDKLADLGLLKPVCQKLGNRATLHILEDADHSFNLPKSSGRSQADILGDLASVIAGWADSVAR